ncbi:MAG: hypothetical protein ACJAXW_003513 [Candidatus Azotimanducaceae bacterium]|jgi:hypothetical protein
MLYDQSLPIRDNVRQSHQAALDQIASPGTWFTAAERLAILSEARRAKQCSLCAKRKQAISPYIVDGHHESVTNLSTDAIEVIHRVITDSGRLTERWFIDMTSRDLTAEKYIEIIGVVATSIIIDSYSVALDCELAAPGQPAPGEPSKQNNHQVFDGGAWVPMLDAPQQASETGLPTQPNIGRAMGLVPSAIALFFPVMRSHYSLSDIELGISREQIELLASRVSSHNQCFY